MNKLNSMVIVVSEQTWPLVEGICMMFKRYTSIVKILIVHTEDDRRSKNPGYRLSHFINNKWPEIEVSIRGPVSSSNPQDVFNVIYQWREENHGHLVVNATGGTKPMFLGATLLSRLVDTYVIYRELDGMWYSLIQCDHTYTLEEYSKPQIGITDSIPISLMVQLQLDGGEDGLEIKCEPAERLPKHDKLSALIKKNKQKSWKWYCNEIGITVEDSGSFFESYVASTLIGLGVINVVKNLKVLRQGVMVLEADVIASHNGRLYFFDCKSGNLSLPPLSLHAKETKACTVNLGGSRAVGIIIRTEDYIRSENMVLLDALDLRYIDRRILWRIQSIIKYILESRFNLFAGLQVGDIIKINTPQNKTLQEMKMEKILFQIQDETLKKAQIIDLIVGYSDKIGGRYWAEVISISEVINLRIRGKVS